MHSKKYLIIPVDCFQGSLAKSNIIVFYMKISELVNR
jgi:hypothetical protein